MRLLKIPLLIMIIGIAITGTASAQVHFGCENLVKSTIDTVRVVSTIGKPGSTVDIPVRLSTDSIVTAFQFLVKFDTTWLTPSFVPDSSCVATDSAGNCITWQFDNNYVDYVINNRFVKTDTSGPFNDIIDTITLFTANLFQGMENVVACNFLPEFTNIDSLPGGDGVIFSLKFDVNPAMPQGQLTQFFFFESDIFTVNDTVFPPDTTFYDGCNESQLTTVWWDGIITQTFQVFPTSNTSTQMLFRADTGAVVAASINLSATPTTLLLPANTSTLAWTATNAQQVVIRNPAGAIIHTTSALSGAMGVTLPSVAGDYTYIAEAIPATGNSVSDEVTISVRNDVGGGPSLVFSPPDLTYAIEQGQTVSFSVNASEADGDQLTLTASGLVPNASFGPSNPALGVGSTAGIFSFTPDFDQLGVYIFTFTAVDKDGTSARSIQVAVSELLVDRLFSTSSTDQQPVGGLKGASEIAFPINLVTAKTVYGVQFDMSYTSSYVSIDSFLVTGRIPEYVVYDNIGQTPGSIRVVSFGLANEPVGVDPAAGSAILWAMMSLSPNAQPWTTHPIFIDGGREAISPDPNVGSLPLQTKAGVIEVDSLGDVNLDKGIDVADAVNIVASILNTYPLTVRQFAVADAVTNDSVNVFDLVGVVNMIYGIPLNSTPAPAFPGDTAEILMVYDDVLAGNSDILTIRSEGIPEELAGVQLEISYDPAAVVLGAPDLTADDEDFAVSYRDDGSGNMKVILYHMAPMKTNELIQAGSADLVTIPMTAKSDVKQGDRNAVRISEAMFSTFSAASVNVSGIDRGTSGNLPTTFALYQNYPNPFNPETRIVFSLSSRAQVELVVYNVLGQEVVTLLDMEMDAGAAHEVVWNATSNDGRRVASGVYLYRLKVGDDSQTRKMLLLK